MKKSNAISLVLVTTLLGCNHPHHRSRLYLRTDSTGYYTHTPGFSGYYIFRPFGRYYGGGRFVRSGFSNSSVHTSVSEGISKGRFRRITRYVCFFIIMERKSITPRNNWQKTVEALGFGFHTTDVPYWDESAYYTFSLAEVEKIETATTELWDRCLDAIQYVIDNNLFNQFGIPEYFVPHIIDTWNNDAPAIYGRFDFWYDGKGEPKLLEFNADTPTSLFEASIVQWFWLKDFDEPKDQFNSLHEKLIEYWKYLRDYMYDDVLYFTCVKDSLEDYTTVAYMQDCAMQGGFDTAFIYIDDIGWDHDNKFFVDLDNRPIRNIFKLYPYEWMLNEDYGPNFMADTQESIWVEPSWKMLLSNKAILPILWQLFPEHKNLLPAYYTSDKLKDFVKKPFLSREGANISLVENGKEIANTPGNYGTEGYIFQQLCKLPEFDGNFPVIGSWVVGQQSAGMGIRESKSLVTDNFSRFVPHLIL